MSSITCTTVLLAQLGAMTSKYKLNVGDVLGEKLDRIASDFDEPASSLTRHAEQGLRPARLLISASLSMTSCAIEVRNQKEALERSRGSALTGRSQSTFTRSGGQRGTERILGYVPGWMKALSKKLLIATQPEIKALTFKTSMTQWEDTLDLAERLVDFGRFANFGEIDVELLAKAGEVVKRWTSASSPTSTYPTPFSVPIGGGYADADNHNILHEAQKNLSKWCDVHKADFPSESNLIADTLTANLPNMTLESPLADWLTVLYQAKALSWLDDREIDDTLVSKAKTAIGLKAEPLTDVESVDMSALDEVKASLTGWLNSRQRTDDAFAEKHL